MSRIARLLGLCLLLLAAPVAGANVCPANPPLFSELSAGTLISTANWDSLVSNSRELCADDVVMTNRWDFATGKLGLPAATTLPATCTANEVHVDSDASPAGQRTFLCTATNTWTLQGDGTGGVAAGGDLAGTYPNPTVAADAVALGTDTTGGYAAAATEGGAATSAKLTAEGTLPACTVAGDGGQLRYDDSGAFCGCDGVAGAWVKLGGGGTCA